MLQDDPDHRDEQIRATYSTIRTGILSLTPGDNKCRFYCRGSRCKYCTIYVGGEAIDGLYSTWITDDILAMSRIMQVHLDRHSIIDKFLRAGIRSIINLQEIGEHAYCGSGNLASGFSYNPEVLMKHGIYHYNFPLPDFEACKAHRLLDIAKVVNFALSMGKIGVHCHAGHGRTGMVIAAWMMYATGISMQKAVRIVRSRRQNSVQSREQIEALHMFDKLLHGNEGTIIPLEKFSSIQDYVDYNQSFITKSESRLYGNIPKIVYCILKLVLERCYETASIHFNGYEFEFNCGPMKIEALALDEQLIEIQLNEDYLDKIQEIYRDMVRKGLTISSMNVYFEQEDFRDLIRFLDLFFHSSFHQLYHRDEFDSILASIQSGSCTNQTILFIVRCCQNMPKSMHKAFARLIPKWFIRSEADTENIEYILNDSNKR